MYKKILLPVDLTERHQPALDIAMEMARPGAATIVLLHVIELIPGLSMEEEKTFYQRLERIARRHLDRWGQKLEERKLPWKAEVLFGNRATESVRYATETAADLIILTAPRVDPTAPNASWGSLSYKISILSQCQVLLVK